MSEYSNEPGVATEQQASAAAIGTAVQPVTPDDVGKDVKRPARANMKRFRVSKQESTFLPAMSMEAALARRAATVEFTRKIMVRNQDFGEISGMRKPALLKPGAEKLCNFFGLEPRFIPVVEDIDWTGEKHGGETFCYVRYQCCLVRQGRILGAGEGSCNSWESRYRYRWVPSDLLPADVDPERLPKRVEHRRFCEFEFAIDRSETTGVYGKPAEYWIQLKEAIRSGAGRRVERETRHGKSPAWEVDLDVTLYRIPNPDVADIINTIQKMAQKRALVAATLIATSASEFFTQDVEDMAGECERFGPLTESDAHLTPTEIPDQNCGTADVQGKPPGSDQQAFTCMKPWKSFGEMRRVFEQMREQVGETRYFEELEIAGVKTAGHFRSAAKALACYARLARIAAEREVA